METNIHGNTLRFIPLAKSGGSVYGVIKTTVSAYRQASCGESLAEGLIAIKTVDETRKDFARRLEREWGMPLDHDIWNTEK